MSIKPRLLGLLAVLIIFSCSHREEPDPLEPDPLPDPIVEEPVVPGELAQLTPNPPVNHTDFQFTIGNKAYAGMGFAWFTDVDTTLYEYDPQVDQWTSKSPIPIGKRSGTLAFSIGTKGYVGGGSSNSTSYQDWWEYIPETDQWTKKKPLPITDNAARVLAAVSIDQQGYLLEIRGNAKVGNLWQYNAEQDQWLGRASLPAEAFITEEEVYPNFFAIGQKGYCLLSPARPNGDDYCNCSLWEYDPQQDRWRKTFTPKGDRYLQVYGRFLFSLNGKGYFLKIIDQDMVTNRKDQIAVVEYDPLKGTFVEKNSGASFPGQKGISFTINDKGYFSVVNRVGSSFWSFKP